MKTAGKFVCPSKISFLKDLADDIWEEDRSWGHAPVWGNSKLSKSGKSHCCYQTANAAVIMLATLEGSGQGKNVALACDLRVGRLRNGLSLRRPGQISRGKNPRPVPPKNGGTRAGHPRHNAGKKGWASPPENARRSGHPPFVHRGKPGAATGIN